MSELLKKYTRKRFRLSLGNLRLCKMELIKIRHIWQHLHKNEYRLDCPFVHMHIKPVVVKMTKSQPHKCLSESQYQIFIMSSVQHNNVHHYKNNLLQDKLPYLGMYSTIQIKNKIGKNLKQFTNKKLFPNHVLPSKSNHKVTLEIGESCCKPKVANPIGYCWVTQQLWGSTEIPVLCAK